MPEKSRQRRVKIAKREGKATAIKSSDVGNAKGLSRHAAKKSRHVEALRTSLPDRSVSRKMPPHMGRGSPRIPNDRNETSDIPRSLETARPAEIDRGRAQQRVISRRSPSSVAAKEARRRK